MGVFKDQHLANLEAWDVQVDGPYPRTMHAPTIEAVLAACLGRLRDDSPAARAALTDGLDLQRNPVTLRRAIERRCSEVINLICNPQTLRSRSIAANPTAYCLPHIAYAGQRMAALNRGHGIPLFRTARGGDEVRDVPEADC